MSSEDDAQIVLTFLALMPILNYVKTYLIFINFNVFLCNVSTVTSCLRQSD